MTRRTVGAVAVVAAVTLLGGGPGTLAHWTDDATLAGGTAPSGTLDLAIGGDLYGPGGTVLSTTLRLGDAQPGESVARAVTLQNVGDAPLRWTMTGSSTGLLADDLLVQVTVGGTAVNAGGAPNRAGSCTGGTTTYTSATLGAAAAPVVSTPDSIAPGGTRQVCVQLRLPATTPSSVQGQTSSLLLEITAEQEQ